MVNETKNKPFLASDQILKFVRGVVKTSSYLQKPLHRPFTETSSSCQRKDLCSLVDLRRPLLISQMIRQFLWANIPLVCHFSFTSSPMLILFTPKGQDGEEIRHTPGSGPSIQDLLALAAITIMLVWPWAFFGAVWIRGGVQLSNHMAKVVTNNPHATTYFVTLICSIIAMITGALFSLAIIRFAQELVTHRSPTRPFHLRVLLSFRHQTWPWRMKDAKYLIHRNRWWPAVLLIVCILTFPHLISSTTSLLAPIPFNRTADLTGTELDFSGGADCPAWFNDNLLTNNCDYQVSEINSNHWN